MVRVLSVRLPPVVAKVEHLLTSKRSDLHFCVVGKVPTEHSFWHIKLSIGCFVGQKIMDYMDYLKNASNSNKTPCVNLRLGPSTSMLCKGQ